LKNINVTNTSSRILHSFSQVSTRASRDLRLLAEAVVSSSVQTRRTLHPRYVLKNCEQKSPKENERRLRERIESAKRNEKTLIIPRTSNESEREGEKERERMREKREEISEREGAREDERGERVQPSIARRYGSRSSMTVSRRDGLLGFLARCLVTVDPPSIRTRPSSSIRSSSLAPIFRGNDGEDGGSTCNLLFSRGALHR